jgi:hypothetical protein
LGKAYGIGAIGKILRNTLGIENFIKTKTTKPLPKRKNPGSLEDKNLEP